MPSAPSHDPAPASVRNAPVARSPLVVPLVLAHAVAMLAWSLFRHRHLGSTADLGAYNSVFWNLAFRGTPWNSIDRVHQWSSHVELGLLWLALPYRIFPTPVWLFITQSACVAASALPIEAVARRVTRDPLVALLVAAATLLTPQLVLAEINDFHPVVLCTLPIAILVWGIEVDSRPAVLGGALAAVLIREHMGLLVFGAGLAWAIRHRGRRREGIALAFLGAATFVALTAWVIPSFGSGRSLRYVTQYRQLGGNTAGALSTILKRPLHVLALPFTAGRKYFPVYLASGGLPLALYSLRSLRRAGWPLVLAAPLFAVQLFSDDPAKWNIHSHYGAPIVPLLAASCALALGLLPTTRDARLYAASGWLMLAMAHATWVMPSPAGPGHPIDLAFHGSARAGAVRRALAMIPRDASVSAQDNVVPHVAERAEVHLFPDGDDTDEYVLLDSEGRARNVAGTTAVFDAVEQLRRARDVVVLVDEAGVFLARRTPR